MTHHDADRADRIVEVIAEYRMTHGYGPSVRDIMARVGLASTSAVHHQLDKLRREGRITWEPDTARSLVLTAPLFDVEPGICARPGCGNPAEGPTQKWCSASCSAIASHVRRWLAATDNEHLSEALGL